MTDQTAQSEPAAGDPLVGVSIADWLRLSSAAVRRSLLPLVVIQLVVFVPVVATAGIAGDLGYFPDTRPASGFGFAYLLQVGPGVHQILPALLGAVGLAASVFVIVRDSAGRAWTARDVLGYTLRSLPRLLGWLVVAAVLTAIGYVLLVVPGIYLSTVFTAALLGVVTIERGGLRRTFALVNDRFFGVLGRLLVLLAISVGYGLVVLVLGGGIGWGAYPGDGRMVVSQLVVGLLTIPLTVYWIAAVVTLYAHLRSVREPDVGATALADELDRG